MSDERMIRFAAPNLASLKVGSLIRCRTTDFDGLLQAVTQWNARLNPKGVEETLLQQKG
ncbi:MAG: hypothetical protein RBU26_11670 [Sphaerochaeta sp.]|uniref:hypothetical protein n=1 Tax=Sphaerochaeta sp. TaxID=1972642 RepID=UPI002A367B5F|nr:hypothetical protein [Sphaerochaeta sp.]MDX9825586.1 hypothetical protein [Sphaerochaeta sp.]